MKKIFKKFSTRLFVGIVLFLISVVFVILLILNLNYSGMKNNITDSYNEVEKNVGEVANRTWYDNYGSMMKMVANEEVNTIDYVFDSIKLDLIYLANMITASYESDKTSNVKLNPPDKTKDGEITPQLSFEPNVNQNDEKIKHEVKVLADLTDDLILNIEYSRQLPRCYVVTDTGIMVMVDKMPSARFDEDGNEIKLTHRDKIWYKNAMATSSVIMSDIVTDILTDNDTLVLLKSFDVNGKRKGVVAFEIYTNLLSEQDIGLKIQEEFDVFIFDRLGGVVFSDVVKDEKSLDPNDNVKEYALSVLKEDDSIGDCIFRGKKNLVYNKKVPGFDWVLLVLVEEDIIKKGVDNLSSIISYTNTDLKNDMDKLNKNILANLTAFSIFVLIITFVLSLVLSSFFSKPLNKLTSEISNTNVEDLKKVSNDYKDEEFKNLADTFNGMIDKINDYVSHIQTITREKENIKAELNVAKRIQQDMLPKNFDSINSRKDINIYAINIPETEVGGDFYNYILLNNKLFLIIADVSGAGVPASLFMAKTNSLINSAIKLSNSPKVILSYVNSELCKSNEENYFVTISIYYIDLNTKKIISTNAGHENPIIIKNNGEVKMIMEKKTAPIGTKPNLIFEENVIELEDGDKLFLYTDGVVEAINDKEELYGDKRLIEVLNTTLDDNAFDIIDKVKDSVMAFSNVPEQYDDITMLCFKFNKSNISYDVKKVHRYSSDFSDKYESVQEINEFIENSLKDAYSGSDDKYKNFLNRIEVCTEEIVVNIIDYAYKDIKIEDLKKISIVVEADLNNDKISITYIDNGPEFNPTLKDDPNILKSANERKIGGLGIYITKQVVDSMEYEYVNNQNKLKLVKYL